LKEFRAGIKRFIPSPLICPTQTKMKCKSKINLYTFQLIQIVSIFEKTTISCALNEKLYNSKVIYSGNQLILLVF